MSASLVGSEMCIRDRSLPKLSTWGGSLHGDSGCADQFCRCPRTACPSGAVSYTHLTLPTICSV
eukprot:7753305-Alexandrium_andersonii.AAC.1